MGKTLREIAEELHISTKKVQLIYAFNGVGKTRLSREFKELVSPKNQNDEAEHPLKYLYYNAFTEDLFTWDNDLELDSARKIIIVQNWFTQWILKDEGKENNIIKLFQDLTNSKSIPSFNENYTEVSFSIKKEDNETDENIKISRGEESCFIWCFFYCLLEEIINVLQESETENRSTERYNQLEYVFIDDPVSSLDENNLIQIAVDLAELIKKGRQAGLKFVITTHNALFYNVLYNELGLKKKKGEQGCGCFLKKEEDGSFEIKETNGDSNKAFSYHIYIKSMIEEAINKGTLSRFHFMLLRNLYEKTANFLNYPQWSALLPEDGRDAYYRRIMNFSSHSTLSNEEVSEPTDREKETIKLLFNHLIKIKYWRDNNNGTI